MSTFETAHVGRLRVPEFERVTFGRWGRVDHGPKYLGVVSYAVRDGHGHKTQAGWGLGLWCDEGLFERWRRFDILQRLYPTFETFLTAMKYRMRYGNVPLPSGIVHNERVNNGGAMLGAQFYGNSLSPTNGTVNAPNRIGLCNLNTFAAAAGDQSLATSSANVTTNEQTANGLGRTSAITPTSVSAQAGLDTQFTDHVTNTFTDTTATSTTYGTGIFDNTTTTFNMAAEATYSTAVTNVGDTLAVDWQRKN